MTGAGGGGGTFVVADTNNTPLVIAGGGGGAGPGMPFTASLQNTVEGLRMHGGSKWLGWYRRTEEPVAVDL